MISRSFRAPQLFLNLLNRRQVASQGFGERKDKPRLPLKARPSICRMACAAFESADFAMACADFLPFDFGTGCAEFSVSRL